MTALLRRRWAKPGEFQDLKWQLLGTLFEETLVHDLISAKTTPQAVIKMFLDICEFNNRWEEIRYENIVRSSI